MKRRLGILSELINEEKLLIKIDKVPSNLNKADQMTRVPKTWLTLDLSQAQHGLIAIEMEKNKIIRNIHKMFHGGVERTFYAVSKLAPELGTSKSEVEHIAKECQQCLSIDPAAFSWEHGTLSVDKVWDRIAVDVTHYEGRKFLKVIDCGPSKYSVWRLIRNEDSQTIIRELNRLFCEFGVPNQILMDNYSSFKSDPFKKFLGTWKITPIFRCANQPEGNGIVERIHCTVKRMAKRSNQKIEESLYWYNNTPNKNDDIPHLLLFNRLVRLPNEEPKENQKPKSRSHDFHVG